MQYLSPGIPADNINIVENLMVKFNKTLQRLLWKTFKGVSCICEFTSIDIGRFNLGKYVHKKGKLTTITTFTMIQ